MNLKQIYLKEREKERKGDIPPAAVCTSTATQLVVGQTEGTGQKFHWVSHVGGRDSHN